MIKKIFISLIFFLGVIIQLPVKAQYYFYDSKYYYNPVILELGVSAGMMNCLTDLGGRKGIGKRFVKDLNTKNFRPDFGIYLMGTWKDAISFRLEGTFGSVQAYDSILKTVAPSTFGRYERNLSFRSEIRDVQFTFEVHPLMLKNYYDEDYPVFSPYAVVGLGFFSFDPKAYLNGNWYSLQPLHTEGEGFSEYPKRKNYHLTQMNIPLGIGVRYETFSQINVRLEIVHRILFTDYLDDVSTEYIDPSLFYKYLPANLVPIAQQLAERRGEIRPGENYTPGDQRGNPKNNDSFFSIQLKVGIEIGRQKIHG